MIVQRRSQGLRLFRQHEHGLASGELALAWMESGASPPVSEEVVLATSLHDLSWRAADQRPRWNPDTGRPLDFLDFPWDRKARMARRGIGRVAELHPYAGVLVSLHYSTFGSGDGGGAFRAREAERRSALLSALGRSAPPVPVLEADLAMLRLFDNVSLFLCLTPPGSLAVSRPGWLTAERFRIPSGGSLSLAWSDPDTLTVTPYPFSRGPLSVLLPYRQLETTSFASQAELDRAWAEAPRVSWRPALVPPPGQSPAQLAREGR